MNQLKAPVNGKTKKKIVGRGTSSGKGRTCGRGDKGYKQRSGSSVKLGFEGGQLSLIRSLPKFGFSNFPYKKKVVEISLKKLEQIGRFTDEINIFNLINLKLIPKQAVYVKIIGKGDLKKSYKIGSEIMLSRGAKEAIEKAGGQIDLDSDKEKSEDQVRES